VAILDDINRAIRVLRYRVSEHAGEEMKADNLREAQLLTAGFDGEVIEDYPGAYPCPACLVLVHLAAGDPVHVVWAFERQSGYAVMVTAYRPDPKRWSADFRKRVKP